MSALETFVLPCIIEPFKDTTFVVKQSLIDYPVFKYVMRSRNPIAVGRTNPRDDLKAVLDGGKRYCRQGGPWSSFRKQPALPHSTRRNLTR